jgi:hypothetical protein
MTTALKMNISNFEQGTKEWHEARRACVTGTKLEAVMGTALARVQLIADLIAEEGTEQTKSFRATPEMERGTAEEPFAVKEYEKRTGRKVSKVGICTSKKWDWLKYSPDGLIPTKGKFTRGIEIKNPNSDTVIFNKLINEVGMQELGLGSWSAVTKNNPISHFKPSAKESFLGVPADYKWQVVCGFLVVDEMEELDFLLHDARFIDPEQRLYVITVKRSDPLMQLALQEAEIELERFRKDWIKWKQIVLPVSF